MSILFTKHLANLKPSTKKHVNLIHQKPSKFEARHQHITSQKPDPSEHTGGPDKQTRKQRGPGQTDKKADTHKAAPKRHNQSAHPTFIPVRIASPKIHPIWSAPMGQNEKTWRNSNERGGPDKHTNQQTHRRTDRQTDRQTRFRSADPSRREKPPIAKEK
jgi:hypothetical protein